MSVFKPVSNVPHTTLVGTSDPDVLRGEDVSEIIRGESGNDRIYGNGGNDIISGGLGRDILEGGPGANTFVYNNITESYQGGGTSYADLIRDFAGIGDNYIDVSAMGFSGLGNGHDQTLRVEVKDDGTRTYLKSYAYDEGGNRFQVAFDGDVSQYLTEDWVIFADFQEPLSVITGTLGPDVLRGEDVSEIIRGESGNDRIYGNGGNDIISGGLGRDILEGGPGANTFVYNNITESYQGGGTSYSDLIRDFVGIGDNYIDVSAMGFSGLGNGHDHTLRVEVNDDGTRTYLKSYAYDEGGNRFQVAFDGDVSQYLTEDRIIFASDDPATSGTQSFLPVDGDSVLIELLGVLPHEPPTLV